MKRIQFTPFPLLCALLAAASAPAADPAAAARKIFADHQDAIVWVSAVAKISVSADGGGTGGINIPDRERKVETLGTIISPSGMIVTTLSGLDPSAEMSGREIRTSSGMVKLDATATMKEVKIILPDATEVPAEVIMRDSDLDLAFVRPKAGTKEAKEATFKAIDLKNAAKANPGDDVVSLGRTDEGLNRQPMVTRGQITAITKKPREFLRVSAVNHGCPTFALDGRLIGIATSRSGRGRASQTVLIPAEDVLEIAEQAKAARPPKGGE